MANKKVMMSVTASAAIAAAIFGAEQAEAASYKVQSGDSLWSIAQKHQTSVSNLKTLNKLTSDVIYPNQVLETSTNSGAQPGNSNKTPKSGTTTPTTNQTTYTVKAGDTLSGIASKHKISLSNLMKWNGLNTTLIYPGNVLKVSNTGNSSAPSTPSKPKEPAKAPADNGGGSVYTVKSGDTLSRIGSQYGVSVANLKQWNNLKSDLIYIGQKLNIKGGNAPATPPAKETPKAPQTDVSYNVDKLISTAKSFNGVKYVWGGSSPSGFDCSGFIYYVYKQAGMDISRTSSAGFFDRSYYVNSPQPGDLVFFSGTYKAGISHMGIYLGNGEFIHAGSDGVEITSVSNSYWKKHFDSYKRFY
ncbi:LysM peptidoglycan-binding domain-containing protein [Oceanobacillus chungangensis]|uniref:Peptidoglycan endopeptidase n=1 Tax=Oceanobacillus chungangensis TaxID=1229152 RepID=A0A3D8PZZ6_9BACI|nr:peptidoglycan endopeptidase [Oceanobacillus chungangensis]RDW20739.1 peptidoglycan endopeptidase [Oceanobacillus chungangensis]